MEATDNKDFWNDLVTLLIAIAVTVAFGLLTSCTTTKYVAVPETHTEYITRTDTVHTHHRDSVYIHDSIFTTQLLQGDTVWRVKEYYRYNIRHIVDTVYKATKDTVLRNDTISIPVPSERQLSKWEQRYIDIGKYACGFIIGLVIIILVVGVWWLAKKK